MANENGKTKYYTLMEELKQAIMSGSIKPGEKLPSENELSDRYHISRHTVRKALSILINEGYIEAEHGRGTFCSQRMGHMKNSSLCKYRLFLYPASAGKLCRIRRGKRK